MKQKEKTGCRRVWALLTFLAMSLLVLAACIRPDSGAKPDGGTEADMEHLREQEPPCRKYSYELLKTHTIEEFDFRLICDGYIVYSTGSDMLPAFTFLKVSSTGEQTMVDPASLGEKVNPKKIENDIDNDGIGEIFISVSDERGPTEFRVLLLASTFKSLAFRDYVDLMFRDADGDGSLEMETRDISVATEWPGNVKPPKVVLTFRGGRIRMSESSRKPVSERALIDEAAAFSGTISKNERIPNEAFDRILELFYIGQARLAFVYFNAVTRNTDEKINFFLENEITLQLINSSAFFDELMDFNDLKYMQPDGEAGDPESASRDRFIGIRDKCPPKTVSLRLNEPKSKPRS